MLYERDLRLDGDGDLQVGDNGDIDLAGPIRTAVQDINFRVQTQYNDFRLHPLIGANLGEFIGKYNTREVGEAIRRAVFRALTRDGRFKNGNLDIRVAPVSREDVVLMVSIIDTVVEPETEDAVLASYLLNYNSGSITVMR